MTVREIARRLHVSPVGHLKLRTGKVQDRPQTGWFQKTTAREDRYITKQAQAPQKSTANRIRRQLHVASHTNVATHTAKNRLHVAKLRARRPAKQPKLKPVHKSARQGWCRCHGRWTLQQWFKVVFGTSAVSTLKNLTAVQVSGGDQERGSVWTAFSR